MDDLNIHRSQPTGTSYDLSHNGTSSWRRPTDIEPGDFIITEALCGVVTQVDTFAASGYSALVRLYIGNVGGVIRSRFDRVQVITPN